MEDNKGHVLGEVIFSSITGFTAEIWQENALDDLLLSNSPGFGSFLKVVSLENELSVLAVVHNVITGPVDTSHRPCALKMTREQLKVEQPQIFALLKTELHAQIVGYFREGRMFCRLPPQPPQIHDFIYPATASEICAVTEDLSFLRSLAGVVTVPVDELLAASVREAYKVRGEDYAFLVAAGQAISQIVRDDYDRLVALLLKVKAD
ncbi:MAG: hypothetical protein HY711_10485 [Candidatus Melainabacteria bacterium]|nr:hypothetical protein [Candidatus Melainabacteria bacterium]